ncbi:hypothetical protein [Anaerostipes faecalis]|uniref:hypothetical protein n=1 Tax=Anaerostipes faecalis TaxID=2738446 RepID=UPI003F110A1E
MTKGLKLLLVMMVAVIMAGSFVGCEDNTGLTEEEFNKAWEKRENGENLSEEEYNTLKSYDEWAEEEDKKENGQTYEEWESEE